MSASLAKRTLRRCCWQHAASLRLVCCRPWKKLNTLRPGDKIINTLFIVLEKQRTTQTKEGNTVHHIVIADNTAKMNASLFDSYGELVLPGDIVRLTGGYCAIYQQASTLYAGKHGKIERIGEFCFPFTGFPTRCCLFRSSVVGRECRGMVSDGESA